MRKPTTLSALACVPLALAALVSSGAAPADRSGPQAPTTDHRVQAWHGNALCYSGCCAGQSPKTETFPSQAPVTVADDAAEQRAAR